MHRIRISPKLAADRLIKSLLTSLLDTGAEASPGSLNLIETGSGLAAVSLLGQSATNSAACHRRARAIGPGESPSPAWAAFLSGRHAGTGIADLTGSVMRDSLRSLHVSRVLVFPVIGARARVAGAVMTAWSGIERPPARTALAGLIAHGARVAEHIAAVLELCGQASTHVVSASADNVSECSV